MGDGSIDVDESIDKSIVDKSIVGEYRWWYRLEYRLEYRCWKYRIQTNGKWKWK